MGIRSWRCWRDTEIWRAMLMSAADLRRSSRASSVSMGRDGDGLFNETVEGEGEPKAALETSLGRRVVGGLVSLGLREVDRSVGRWGAEVVVAALLRRPVGAGWIWICFWRGAALYGEEVMLDADVEVEWLSERDEAEPEEIEVVVWTLIICQVGSSILGFIATGILEGLSSSTLWGDARLSWEFSGVQAGSKFEDTLEGCLVCAFVPGVRRLGLFFGRGSIGICGAGPTRVALISLSSDMRANDDRDGESAAGDVFERWRGDGVGSRTVRRCGLLGVDGKREKAGLFVG